MLIDYDLDLDFHTIWHESSDIPTPPPCLATDPNDLWQDFLGKDNPAEHRTQEPSLIECLFYPILDSLSGFKWTGPHSLTTLLGLATFSSTCQRSFSLKRCIGPDIW
jgi:hypothetical protein